MRAALLRQRPAIVVPSPAAVERVLWLAAVDCGLRCGPRDADEVRAAYRALRALIDRAAPSLYGQTPLDEAREVVWIGRMRESLDAGTPAERAATVVWAAVGAWTDAPSGRWGALADAGADLGDALDVGGVVVPRRATALRETMAVVWRSGGSGDDSEGDDDDDDDVHGGGGAAMRGARGRPALAGGARGRALVALAPGGDVGALGAGDAVSERITDAQAHRDALDDARGIVEVRMAPDDEDGLRLACIARALLAAEASAAFSAQAAVDAARELGHVASAAVTRADAAEARLAAIVEAVRAERNAVVELADADRALSDSLDMGARQYTEARQNARAAVKDALAALSAARTALDAALNAAAEVLS